MRVRTIVTTLILSALALPATATINDHSNDLKNLLETKQCRDCDLTRNKINPSYNVFNLDHANIQNSYLTAATLTKISFIESVFSFNNFTYAQIEDSIFKDLQMSNCYFEETTIRHNNFDKTQIKHSNFIRSTLNSNSFRKASFNECTFKSVEFQSAPLTYAKFTNCSMDNVDFSESNLSFTDFSNTTFNNVVMDNVNLQGSNISETQLKNVRSKRCAIMPDGSVFDNNGKYDC